MKVGLLGGSFDPPHFGHIGISLEALNLLDLEQIWWLPAKQNPLKNSQFNNFEERLNLCQKIAQNYEKILIKDDEKSLQSRYFIDLLQYLKNKNPNIDFTLLIGLDNLNNFHLWKDWQEIIKLTKIAVFKRAGYETKDTNSTIIDFCLKMQETTKKQHLIFLDNKQYDISSTKIREIMNKKFDFIVDSHCHLDLIEEKGENIDEIVAQALDNKVEILQTICTRISKFPTIYSYATKYQNVFASIGNHPCNVKDEPMAKAQQIIDICNSHPKLIGIGETGLDYYHDASNKPEQKQSFLEHIAAARVTGLPLIIHNRDSDEDMAKILEDEMKKGHFKALLHCFSSSKELAKCALNLGIYISISGIITFKNANNLQEIVKDLPLDKLLVETDSPYLAPTPYRGQLNKPAYTKNTVEFIANLKNLDKEELYNITTKNFFNLFSKCSI